MDVSKLIEECETRVGWASIWWHSFTGNFKETTKGISFELKDEKEVDKFIKVCDNRIERAKTLLSDVATVLGFDITAISIILALSFEEGKMPKDPFMTILTGQYGILFSLFIAVLLSGVFVGILMLIHHRTQIHAWSAFKQAAILSEKYSSEGNKKC